jgi:hemerythrin
MLGIRYPGFDGHKADHERLLDEIRDLMEEQHAAATADLSGQLVPRLERWFMRHFHDEDARLHGATGPSPA